MSTQVVLTLADDVMQKAASWAGLTRQPIHDFLSQAVAATVSPLGVATSTSDLTAWTDAEVLDAANVQSPPETDRRLSDLLRRQQANQLANGDRAELQALMQVYQSQLLLKACALREAVRRGLREPLEP